MTKETRIYNGEKTVSSISGARNEYKRATCKKNEIRALPKTIHTPVCLSEKSHGQRNLVGYHPWDHKKVGHNLATKQQMILKNLIFDMNNATMDIFG